MFKSARRRKRAKKRLDLMYREIAAWVCVGLMAAPEINTRQIANECRVKSARHIRYAKLLYMSLHGGSYEDAGVAVDRQVQQRCSYKIALPPGVELKGGMPR